MLQRFKSLFYLFCLFGLTLPYQNCGNKMMSAHYSAVSTQCRPAVKSQAILAKAAVMPQFHCEDFNNYSCEQRIFSPAVDNMTHFLRQCIENSTTCVDVEVHQFSTAAAQKNEAANLFAPGAAYNHDEFKCHHRFVYNGVAVFEGEGASLAEALAGALKECDGANTGGA
jgi:hypothetical protein